jgi:hypothetical protein
MKYTVAELNFVATKAWYDDGMICVLLDDGREIRFPVYLNERLKNAKPSVLDNIEIICNGTGLHWPELDEDLSVAGIMEGRVGRKTATK